MTNQEFLIKALNDEFDDAGITREAVVYYDVACPHYVDSGECNHREKSREVCVECKEKWLKAEVET